MKFIEKFEVWIEYAWSLAKVIKGKFYLHKKKKEKYSPILGML